MRIPDDGDAANMIIGKILPRPEPAVTSLLDDRQFEKSEASNMSSDNAGELMAAREELGQLRRATRWHQEGRNVAPARDDHIPHRSDPIRRTAERTVAHRG